ncbi:preprotein translocase subunit YajC [Lentilactobacillus sunkii]|jgi:preprotein translocase subunit YajC|uniref:Preprotein translocase subunit YajC n=2 Tax=Lentilactobacillus sunkii TaxID=481719 RepID=A0A0R1L038_9LACO|nr:preprotein translocase subunit YajC [Lentilactobacillus sunkii]KRK89163.1 preprotein translocase subunit YajC [Lentilactobacillus sunkii DSM 19904]OFA11148.1 preprotein translocase subunit YajC [Lentilactobacillus sunkii]
MIVVLFAVMYFLMIRPQRKQQQKRREQLSKIKEGDQVITIGRLHGVVDEINEAEKTVTLDCDGIYLVFDLSAIASVKQPAVATPAANSNADAGNKASDDNKDDSAASDADQKSTESSDQAHDDSKSEEK